MVNARPPLLYQHVFAKHPDLLNDLTRCFSELAGYDPKYVPPNNIRSFSSFAFRFLMLCFLVRLTLIPKLKTIETTVIPREKRPLPRPSKRQLPRRRKRQQRAAWTIWMRCWMPVFPRERKRNKSADERFCWFVRCCGESGWIYSIESHCGRWIVGKRRRYRVMTVSN